MISVKTEHASTAMAPAHSALALAVLWLRSSRHRLAWAATAILLDALLTLGRPWPLKIVIDYIIVKQARPLRVPWVGALLSRSSADASSVLAGCCAASLAIALGTGVLTYSFTRTMGDVGRHFAFELRRDLFAHLQRLSVRFHDAQRTGDLTARLTSDIQSMQEALTNGVIVFASNALLLAGMAATMFWLDWRFALVALSIAPILFWTVLRYTRRIKLAARAARQSDGLLASLAQETLASIRIVQGLAREDLQADRFETHNQSSLRASLDGVRYQARTAPLVDVLAGAGAALVMWYGATGVMRGALTTGDVVVFFAYVTNLYSPMRALAKLSHSLAKAEIGAERVAALMSVTREVTDLPGALKAPRLGGQIELCDVSFEYTRGRPVLGGISVRIAAGETVAIVGVTGAGKSTLIGLIPRLYDPQSGAVRVDGVDIRKYELRSLREQIGVVLQESLLFSGTIYDNIAFGRSDATESDVTGAAIAAEVDEFIRSLPDGYDTFVGERGVTLSGGQRQRIAIARAIVRDARILILDEPTSGLDAATERKIIDTLERAARGRTTLIIAHRLSTVRIADRILVLAGGRIAEEGTHDDLLRRGGPYAELYFTSQGITSSPDHGPPALPCEVAS